jgi:filamentous hemagglutinin family protein
MMMHMKETARMERGISGTLHRKTLPMLLAGCLAAGPVQANPAGQQVVNGQATFTNQNGVLSIVNTPGAIINWQSFSIDAGETTRFLQQSASSAVLNRILGQDPSRILGALQSNGKVFLINPNGVLFGQGSQVNVNGLVASTLNITNEDFIAGRLNFKAGDKAGDLKNQGAITTPAGGQVFLIAPNVENSGIIASPKGDVVLAAGHSVQLVDSADPNMQVVVSAPEHEALNLGQVVAQGGRIGIYGALVNQRGLVSADSAVVGENGKIVFKASGTTMLGAGSVTSATGIGQGGEIDVLGDRVGLLDGAGVNASGRAGGGTVLIGGDYHGGNAAIQNAKRTYVGSGAQIKADATDSGDGGKVIVWSDEATRAYGSISARGGEQGGNGGFVETSGHYLDSTGVRVDARAPRGATGTWLLDPTDIVVAASGTASLTDVKLFANPNVDVSGGSSTIDPATINGATANVVLQATNDITFSDPVSVAAAGIGLTARAGNNIHVNAAIATNGGAITLSANDAGGPATGTGMLALNDVVSSAGAAVNLSGDSIELGGGVYSGGGAITVNASGSIDMDGGGNLSTLAGDFATGVVTMTAGTYISLYDPIYVKSLKLSAPYGITVVNNASALTLGGATSTSGTVDISNGNGTLTVTGAVSAADVVSLSSGGDLLLNANVVSTSQCGDCAPRVELTASGGIKGSGTVSGPYLTSTSATGTMLNTSVNELQSVENTGPTGDIYIINSKPLTVTLVKQTNGAGSTGAIIIDNTGTLTISGQVVTGGGGISLTAHSPLDVSGSVTSTSGDIALTAGSSGTSGSGDNLTITGAATVSTGGSISLWAGDAITIQAGATVSPVPSQSPNNNPAPAPTLSQCIADPTLAGCSTVLPTLSQCTTDPTLAGCSVVLPTLAQCIATPTLSGCSVVLPTLTQCIATPTLAGCSVVLPTASQCAANPVLPGCSAVLPTLAQCIATPTLSGCSAVLPTLAQCIATPTLSGCSVMLPTLAQCIATPTLSGCSVVLPTLAQCIATPTLSGCTAVLPTLAQCIATPTLSGCSVVLPTLTQCVVNPALSGCSAVLPTLAQCIAIPSLPGCSAVLPTLTQCVVSPTLQGCSVVLPTVSTCATNPTMAGCEVVLPTTQTQTNEPVTQAINSTVNLINTTIVPTGLPVIPGGTTPKSSTSTSGTSSSTSTKKTDTVATNDSGVTKNDAPATKMYCN